MRYILLCICFGIFVLSCNQGEDCVPGRRRCVSSNAAERCSSASQWTREACTANEECKAGQCIEKALPVCTPGQKRCDDTMRMLCLQDNTWSQSPCAAGEVCQSGECKPIQTQSCTVGETRCEGNARMACQTDGSWSRTPCQSNELCQMGQCQKQTACQPSETRSCYGGSVGEVGKGGCTEGVQTCDVNGNWAVDCVGEVLPSPEKCDALDNDCDGKIDEDFADVGKPCEVGKGECLRRGMLSCSVDGSSVQCDAQAGKETPESCDGKDNDCDGQIDNDIYPPCCPAGSSCFRKEGLFHKVTMGNESQSILLKPPAGTYSRILILADAKHGGWNNEPSGTRFALWWLSHNDVWLNLYGYLIFTVPNVIVFRHGHGLTPTEKPKLSKQTPLTPGTTYRMIFDYDTKRQSVSLTISILGGANLATLTDKPNISQITVKAGDSFPLHFSSPAGGDPKEPPAYGWEFSNVGFAILK